MAENKNDELKSINYELFILALSILSIVNIGLAIFSRDQDVLDVIWTVDLGMSIILIGDFLFRLFTAESKQRYFLRQYGWLDLIGSLPVPGLRLARLSRIFRASRLMRKYGTRDMLRKFQADRAGTALLAITFLIILLLEFGSIAIVYVERDAPDANIKTAADALWWSIVTMSTVGYGDQYPVTNAGRIVGMLVIITGVGMFGVLTGYLARYFLGSRRRNREKQTNISTPPDKSEAILEEIKQLRVAQEQATTEFNSRMAALERLLKKESQEK